MTALIALPSEDTADGELQIAYARIRKERGAVANVYKIHGTRPATMLAHLDLYKSLLFSASELTRLERELIATVVSAVNQCEYCTHHHSVPLRQFMHDDVLVDAVIANPEQANLTPRWRAIVDVAIHLTRRPHELEADEIQSLRQHGLSDAGVHDVIGVAAYFNFVNRLVLGVHLPLETA